MGRTVLSFTQKILSIEAEWAKFRRALRKEDQQLLDELFAYAKFHSAPASYLSTPNPMEAILVSVALELLKEVKRLKLEIQNMKEAANVREKDG